MLKWKKMSKEISVIDEPVAPGAADSLGIDIHSKSLIDFITGTSTPITIGIQGEWGSGKTSLINSIYYAFDSNKAIKQIWINSWEFSLLSSPEEALLKIINRIIDELLESDMDIGRRDAIKEGAGKIFRGALRVGAQVALGTEAAKVANELLDSSDQGISTLRQQLGTLVDDIAERSSNPYKKVIIYVDDLDRIEPRNAVAVLELLKNIFNVPRCVFVLAIDYQVVVKGLEHKFGKQTPENEWEFRAFFDKIIQLPFMMPMGQYNIGKYVNSLLVNIGFVKGDGLDDEAIREIILRTIGGNPRSIKRLANSVSLIQIFVKNKKEMSSDNGEDSLGQDNEETISVDEEKHLLFALLCIQIAYPPIYSLLIEDPDFTSWNDDFAFKQTNRSEERVGNFKPEEMKAIFEDEFAIAKKTEDFDEDWEQALFRICYARPRLKPRTADISKFFSYIKDVILSERQEIIGATIARLLTQTSVTSVTSEDMQQPQAVKFTRTFYDSAEAWIKILNERNIPERYISAAISIKELFQHEKIIFKYTKLAGCTVYIDNKKIAQILLGGKRKVSCSVFLLKDYKFDYRIPRVPGMTTSHIQHFKLDKPFSAHNAQFYKAEFASENDISSNICTLKKLVERGVEIGESHQDKIYPTHKIRANIEKGDQETIDYALRTLGDDYTYDLDA
jgi:hypothetical protein